MSRTVHVPCSDRQRQRLETRFLEANRAAERYSDLLGMLCESADIDAALIEKVEPQENGILFTVRTVADTSTDVLTANGAGRPQVRDALAIE